MTTTDNGHDLFDLFGRLDISLGRSADALERAAQRKPAQPQPVSARMIASGIVPASGPLILKLGDGPSQGRIWHVRSIVVGGATPVTSAAGRADIFVSATDLRLVTSLTQIGIQDWRDQANTLPLVSFYGNGEIPLRLNEDLFVAFSNGTPSQQLTACATIEEVEEGDITLTWGL